MAATQFAGLPRRIHLELLVPEMITDRSVDECCAMAAARIRYLLGKEYQRRSAVRFQARQDARAVRKAERAARLDAAARQAEEEERLAEEARVMV